MSTDGQGGGFFSRWSRQKAADRAAEPAAAKPKAQPASEIAATLPTTAPTNAAGPSAVQAKPPLPDVEQLTPQSDYTAFMAPDVAPALRSRALKKLFTDPHFNVMDGLDTYIDDYGKPDPIPESWYGRMNRIAGDMRPEPEPEPEAEQGGAIAAANPDDTSPSQSTEVPPSADAMAEAEAETVPLSGPDGDSLGTSTLDAPSVDAPSPADTTKPIQAH